MARSIDQQLLRRLRNRAKAPRAIGTRATKDGSGVLVTSVVSRFNVENTSLAPLKAGLVVGERMPRPGPCKASENWAVPLAKTPNEVLGMVTDKTSYSLFLEPRPAFRASATVLSAGVRLSPPVRA